MDAQIAAQLPARRVKAGSQQELGRPERPAGEHHRAPGTKLERARSPVRARQAVESGGLPPLEDDAPSLHLSPDPRARRDGARQIGNVHGPLCIQPAAGRARAALVAGAGVSVQGLMADAERLRAPRRSWPFRPIRSGSTGRTLSISSAASYSGSSWAAHVTPWSLAQPASTSSGARKQVPELIT